MTQYNVEIDDEAWAKVKAKLLPPFRHRALLMELLSIVMSGSWSKLFAEKNTKTDRKFHSERCEAQHQQQL
jgi:hypothetical protein